MTYEVDSDFGKRFVEDWGAISPLRSPQGNHQLTLCVRLYFGRDILNFLVEVHKLHTRCVFILCDVGYHLE